MEKAKLLIQRGANIHAIDNQNKTPLDYLTSNHEAETLRAETTFFGKMFQEDERNIIAKFDELIPLIEHVHHTRVMYTILSIAEQSKEINRQDRKRYTLQMLERTINTNFDPESYAIYKLILEKALKDKLIDSFGSFT